MKKISFTVITAIIVLVTLLASSCEDRESAEILDNKFLMNQNFLMNQPFILHVGETKFNQLGNLSVTFDSVLNDSRCPLNAYCVWAGNAKTKIIFDDWSSSTILNLDTFEGTIFKRDTSLNHYRIELKKLSPYPKLGEVINQSDYYAEIIVRSE